MDKLYSLPCCFLYLDCFLLSLCYVKVFLFCFVLSSKGVYFGSNSKFSLFVENKTKERVQMLMFSLGLLLKCFRMESGKTVISTQLHHFNNVQNLQTQKTFCAPDQQYIYIGTRRICFPENYPCGKNSP